MEKSITNADYPSPSSGSDRLKQQDFPNAHFNTKDAHSFHRPSHRTRRIIEFTGYPDSILCFDSPHNADVHPTEKPIELLEYLIKTYTRTGDLVLDPFCGSGTTAIAARNTGRNFIVGDFLQEYVDVTNARLSRPFTPPLFDLDAPPAPRAETLPLWEDGE